MPAIPYSSSTTRILHHCGQFIPVWDIQRVAAKVRKNVGRIKDPPHTVLAFNRGF